MAEFVTPTAEREHLGGGVYRTTVHLAPVAYADAGGVLRRIAADWADGDGTYPHVVSAARMRVRTAPNGDRLLLPVPGDDEAWFSISSPFINVGGNWTQPSLGMFTRSGNQLTATAANVITRINHAGHYIKAEYELLNGWTPANGQFAYRVGLNGLTRQGGTLLYNGTPVMQLRKPVAYDADNEQDTRTIAHEFVQLGGNWYVLFTLPSLAGMSRPVVDPTFSVQPDATAGEDTYILNTSPDLNAGTNVSLFAGDTTVSFNQSIRSLIKFDVSSIPSGSTISSATFSLYENLASGSTTENATIHRLLRDWVEAQATWNIYSTGNSWSTAGASGDGTDRVASASATTALNNTASNAFIDWSGAGVVSDVSAWVNGSASNYGWLLICANKEFRGTGATGVEYNGFASSDNTTAANRPKLVIEYTEPTGPAIPVVMQHRRTQGMS